MLKIIGLLLNFDFEVDSNHNYMSEIQELRERIDKLEGEVKMLKNIVDQLVPLLPPMGHVPEPKQSQPFPSIINTRNKYKS